MSNMAYCRFRNTLPDLRDCYNNLSDEPEEEEERKSRKSLVDLCVDIAIEFGYIVDREITEED